VREESKTEALKRIGRLEKILPRNLEVFRDEELNSHE